MAACNLVLGVGSYTYQFKSRDSLGFAVKATAVKVNGELKPIFKHPKTDDGTKNSLKGLIRVEQVTDDNGKTSYVAYDEQSEENEKEGCLETVFKDGQLIKAYSLSDIRQRIDSTL
jgi:nicotinamide phosphoribosyltransferase